MQPNNRLGNFIQRIMLVFITTEDAYASTSFERGANAQMGKSLLGRGTQ